MPWCPICKVEYDENTEKCIDCGGNLVDVLIEKNCSCELDEEEEDDKGVFLISAQDEMEANIIEAKLKQYRIPVLKKFRETGGYLSVIMGVTPFGIDMFVPSKLLEDAQKIIEPQELSDDFYAEGDEGDEI